jgi:hypothetical protein
MAFCGDDRSHEHFFYVQDNRNTYQTKNKPQTELATNYLDRIRPMDQSFQETSYQHRGLNLVVRYLVPAAKNT